MSPVESDHLGHYDLSTSQKDDPTALAPMRKETIRAAFSADPNHGLDAGFEITVERDPQRIFDDAEFKAYVPLEQVTKGMNIEESMSLGKNESVTRCPKLRTWFTIAVSFG
ncbi:hypothetical protein JVT61DRAFT_7026 [Boletus reticuloceps]|uniref:Uncharacterized protein n=1 Tax=Boletus reticuloceps TaxID=495285 RepID=A0A8I2YIM5_9AGAM|nr:hypothetical protein JVT61DRAFT_7026 [Boletus reticuloceps]